MKTTKTNIILMLLLLVSMATLAQTTVTLQSACATCPNSTTTSPFSEPTPCDGLKDARDFSSGVGIESANKAGIYSSGFISKEGIVYIGWYNYDALAANVGAGTLERCVSGQARPVSTTVTYSKNNDGAMYTSFPAKNVLIGAPGQTFKAIQKVRDAYFILSDQGKIYNWGPTVSADGIHMRAVAGPASQTLAPNLDCSTLEVLREVVHPQGKKWKSMQAYTCVVYAGDESGQWWCWGEGPKASFPTSQVTLPSTSESWYIGNAKFYTPVQMDVLPRQPRIPQSDDQQTLVGAVSSRGNGVEFLSYIGTDSLIYTYRYDYTSRTSGTFIRATSQNIPLPGNVKALKIQRGHVYNYRTQTPLSNFGGPEVSIDYVLGTDGKIYRFAEGLPPATSVALGNYTFQDFIVKDPYEFNTDAPGYLDNNISMFDQMLHALDLVPVGGSPLVVAKRGGDMGNGVATPGTLYDVMEFGPAQGVNFKISKLWSSTTAGSGFTILKSADTGHSYGIKANIETGVRPNYRSGNVAGSGAQASMSIAFGADWNFYNNEPQYYGPYKLINCQN
ncbi:hypothetical protein [Arsenicibacter rosenii]|nr:hypothetical protein [Arsenicibacter rosenii]